MIRRLATAVQGRGRGVQAGAVISWRSCGAEAGHATDLIAVDDLFLSCLCFLFFALFCSLARGDPESCEIE